MALLWSYLSVWVTIGNEIAGLPWCRIAICTSISYCRIFSVYVCLSVYLSICLSIYVCLCLRLPLVGLLEAESRGRWWRTGAKWTGRVSTDTDTDRGLHLTDRTTETGVMGHDGVRETYRAVTPTTTTTTATASSLSSHTVGGVVGTEEQRLLRLATKLRMNSMR